MLFIEALERREKHEENNKKHPLLCLPEITAIKILVYFPLFTFL